MTKITVEQMLEAGLHFGHQTFRWNPKMRPFIFEARDGIHIIDLTQTEQKLREALNFVSQIAKEGKNLLIVGTKRQANKIVKEQAEANALPFVSTKWPGGLLTNFKTIKKRIDYLKQLRKRVADKDFADMTKKEIGLLNKELARLEKSFGGLDTLVALPAAIFIVDAIREKIAVKEAIKLNIPIIAMVDTNADPSGIEFVIPANDDAKNGILLITKAIAEVFSKDYKQVIEKSILKQTPQVNIDSDRNDTAQVESEKHKPQVEKTKK